MSGVLPSFLAGSQLIIRIGNRPIAEAVAMSFQDNMDNAQVFSIGSTGPSAIEPLMYSASGSITITRYSDIVLKNPNIANPANVFNTIQGSTPPLVTGTTIKQSDGNSLAEVQYFSPALLMLSSTFDIDVYTRTLPGGAQNIGQGLFLTYKIVNCRISSLEFNFTPGQLVNETYAFLAQQVMEVESEANKGKLPGF